jgi:hypothetical protein
MQMEQEPDFDQELHEEQMLKDERASGYIARHDPEAMADGIMQDTARKFTTELNEQIELLAEEKDLNSYEFTQAVIQFLRNDWNADPEPDESAVQLDGDDDGSGIDPHKR